MPTDLFTHNLISNKSSPMFQTSASTEYDGNQMAWRAFDGDNAHMWLTTGATSGWLMLQFYWAQLVDSYSITTGSDYATSDPGYPTTVERAPKTWTFEGSNNGTTWTTLDTRASETGWGYGETRTYSCSVTGTPYLYFRVNISANNGSAQYVQIGELHLYATVAPTTLDRAPHNMTGPSVPSPYVAAASTHETTPNNWDAFRAFDGIFNTDANRWAGTNSGVDWLRIDLGSSGAIAAIAYSVQAYRFDGTQEPKNWTFQGSNDASSWATLDTQTNQTIWEQYESKTFTFSNTTAYRYYRLNVSANNGSTYTSVAEMYIFSPPPSAAAGGLFRPGNLSGLGTGGKFFSNPLN